MAFELTKTEDLAKAGHSIGNFFYKRMQELEKTHAFHAAMAVHHEAMATAHTAHSSANKTHHAGLADDDVHKAMFATNAAHHAEMAAHHSGVAKACAGHADSMKSEIDTMKTLAAEWGVTKADTVLTRAAGGTLTLNTPSGPTGNAIADMVSDATTQLTKKALEKFDSDPEVQSFLRETVMKMVGQAMDNTLIPTAVSAVTPGSGPANRAVTRAGQPPLTPAAAAAAAEKVPLEFRKLISVEDGEEERPIL